jgi:hypothetical protein
LVRTFQLLRLASREFARSLRACFAVDTQSKQLTALPQSVISNDERSRGRSSGGSEIVASSLNHRLNSQTSLQFPPFC